MTSDPLIRDLFAKPILDQMPRLLTQVDRNAHSPTYGSCCRNFWHYRIEDISNAQMQELVLTLALAYRYESPNNSYYQSEKLLRWIDAILLYTCGLQRPSGSFDEVYRGQDSYAATAFVGFYVSETLLQLKGSLAADTVNRCLAALRKSAAWLARTDEDFAGNQLSGAAAFVYNLAELSAEEDYARQGRALLESIRSIQSEEGWFKEYGGADIGYASLTLAYLALIHHRHHETLAREMALSGARFLRNFIHPDGSVGGEYGSRNTEYFIPLGPLLLHGASEELADLRCFLVSMLAQGGHEAISHGLDDRYFAYLSPFYMLAAQIAGDTQLDGVKEREAGLWRPHNVYLPDARLWAVSTPAYQLIANLAKGGIFRINFGGQSITIDDGIFGTTAAGAAFTTQYLDRSAQIENDGRLARVRGAIFINKPVLISPLKNVLVRTFNFSVPGPLRRVFLDFLRKRAVSSGAKIGAFERTITLHDDGIEVVDSLTFNVPVAGASLVLDKERAFSFASTGFFQSYEMQIRPGRSMPLQISERGPLVLRRRVTKAGVEFTHG